jgi:hypothetical protein
LNARNTPAQRNKVLALRAKIELQQHDLNMPGPILEPDVDENTIHYITRLESQLKIYIDIDRHYTNFRKKHAVFDLLIAQLPNYFGNTLGKYKPLKSTYAPVGIPSTRWYNEWVSAIMRQPPKKCLDDFVLVLAHIQYTTKLLSQANKRV